MHIGTQSPGFQNFAIQRNGHRPVPTGSPEPSNRGARRDSNGDGLLGADALNRKGGQRTEGPSQAERALVAKFADLLTERTPPGDLGEDIAKEILARLDADGSDGLNSEEIADTRLAEAIGSDFYQLDSDKNGALDKAELSAFITSEYLGLTEERETGDFDDDHHEGDESDEHDEGDVNTDLPLALASVGPVGVSDTVIVDDTVAVTQRQPAAEPTSSGPAQASYAEQVLSSFEAALALLQQGSRQQQATLEMARTLYTEVRGALGTA